MLLESIKAADSLARVATEHKWESIVCKRLLNSHPKLLKAPHDSELVMGAMIRRRKRRDIEQLHIYVPLAFHPVAAREPLRCLNATGRCTSSSEWEADDADALNILNHFNDKEMPDYPYKVK